MSRSLVFTLAIVTSVAATACGGSGWSPRAPASAQSASTTDPDVAVTIEHFRKLDPTLEEFFDESYGYAVFPTVGKGGAGIGGAYGEGEVYEQNTLIGKASLTQVTVGFQLGGQAHSQIIFFRDKKTLDDFRNGNFELGAQASAVAVTAGASADAAYDHGVAVFTSTNGGLMYEATVAGQKFGFEPI